jgi:hypothetical protein
LQRDIAVFWGSYATAQAEATKLLFSLGKMEVILAACTAAAAEGIGFLDGDHSLQLHSSLVPRLPAVLRAYVGCASRLYGEVEAADLVKIHVQSGKLSLMSYDDFTGKALPLLAYPGFVEEAFPALVASWVVDLGAGTVSAHRLVQWPGPGYLERTFSPDARRRWTPNPSPIAEPSASPSD